MSVQLSKFVSRPDLREERQREADKNAVLIRGKVYAGPVDQGDGYAEIMLEATFRIRQKVGAVEARMTEDDRLLEVIEMPVSPELEVSGFTPLTDDERWKEAFLTFGSMRFFVDGECLNTGKSAELTIHRARPSKRGGPFLLETPSGETGPFSVRITDS